jgi:acetylornithine deacetylase/succinyl-diaminopimelate desuccinylase-like protein
LRGTDDDPSHAILRLTVESGIWYTEYGMPIPASSNLQLKVSDYIERHASEYLEHLSSALRQPSISTENLGITEMAELVRAALDDIGAETDLVPTSGHPVVMGEVPSAQGLTVLIYGHYDVQPTGALQEWDSLPFEPTVRGGRIFARGSADNKGQFLAQIYAVRALRDVLGEVPVRIRFLIEGEEEIGSPHLRSVLETYKRRLASDVFLRADGAIHYSGRPQIVLGQKGMLYVELYASNGRQEVHSMEAPVMPNPAWELVATLNSLRNDAGVLLKGFYDDVRPLSKQETEVFGAIPLDLGEYRRGIGVDRLTPGLEGANFWAQLHLAPTCNIAGIRAGYAGPGSKTIVPAEASAKLDLRLVPDQDPDAIFEALQAHVAVVGGGNVIARKLKAIHPARTDMRHPVVAILREALRQTYQVEPVVLPSSKGSGPAHVFNDVLEVPYLLVPMAQIDSNMHGPNENLRLDLFVRGIQATANVILGLALNKAAILSYAPQVSGGSDA